MKLRDGCLERSRTDLHLTSTGKGHGVYKPLEPFPPADFGKNDFFFNLNIYGDGLLEQHFRTKLSSSATEWSSFRLSHWRTL